MAWRHLLPPLLSLLPSTPEFTRLHFCFALAAKHLPREEDPVRCWVWGLREGRRESYCCSYHTVRFVAFQGNHLVLAFPGCPGHHEVLGQSLICSPVNTEGLSCGKQVRKFSCFYQRWENIQAAPDSTSFPHRHSGTGIPQGSITTKTHSTSQHPCLKQPPPLPPPLLIACVPGCLPLLLPGRAASKERHSAKPGKICHWLSSPLAAAHAQKRTCRCTNPWAWTCDWDPCPNQHSCPKLCGALGSDESWTGSYLGGDEEGTGTWGAAAQCWGGSGDGEPDFLQFSLPSPPALHLTPPFPSYHTAFRTPSLPQGSGHPRSEAVGKQEERLTHSWRCQNSYPRCFWSLGFWCQRVLLTSPASSGTSSATRHAVISSCKGWSRQNPKTKTWDTSCALPIFPLTPWSCHFISAPCQRARGKFAPTSLQDMLCPFLLPPPTCWTNLAPSLHLPQRWASKGPR